MARRRRRSRRYLAALELARKGGEGPHGVLEGVRLAKEASFAKFDESLDLALRLGVDPRHADQMVRGAVALPSGTGKPVTVCVVTSGENLDRALAAGADHVGGDDLIAKIAGGWVAFDRVVASPDMMGRLGRVGRVLGPRGLMPNPKLGTVTPDVARAVAEQKAGKVEYRTEKNGIIHVPAGRKSLPDEAVKRNIDKIVETVVKAKPAAAKGTYLRSATLSATMGPGVKIEVGQ